MKTNTYIPQPTEQDLLEFQRDLKTLRHFIGWSQTDLGKMLGVSKQNISAIENGKQRLTLMHWHAIMHIITPAYNEELARLVLFGDGESDARS